MAKITHRKPTSTTPPAEHTKLLTVGQAAQLFNKSTKTVVRWMKAGKLTAHKPGRPRIFGRS